MCALSFEPSALCGLKPLSGSPLKGERVKPHPNPLLKRGGTELARGLFFLALVLLYRLGRDGGRGLGLRRVVLLNVSCGSGDSPPCLATTDADEYGGHDYRTKQNNCPRFRFVLFHLRCIF